MSIVNDKTCGCKGIRTCLLCEGKEILNQQDKNTQVRHVYTYCSDCGLCWPDATGQPLYLGKLKIFPDFVSEDEEAVAISEIDKIQWMPSQSGRRKQDFGPKVNFKKKKVKVGEFKGFPKFTNNILQKFKTLTELMDFQPVELCHLEYSPDRGSSIDPHVDDSWLWGERLVTVNLGSSTVLTLKPFHDNACECSQESCSYFTNLQVPNNTADIHDISALKSSLDSLNVSNAQSCCHHRNRNSDYSTACNAELLASSNIESLASSDAVKFNEESITSSNAVKCNGLAMNDISDMCRMFRSGTTSPEAVVAVRVVLPPKSLLVLSGCARYNWVHEIKRQDVVSRRVAMTFRELTPEFLGGGKESHKGEELLSIASNFCEFSSY